MILPALFAAALSFAEPCGTCSCVGPGTPQSALESATAAFTGTVVSVRESTERTEHGRWPVRVVRFRVDGAWKGVNAPEVTVLTGMGGGDCGLDFDRGVRYLVYAYGGAGRKLSTGLCTRTAPAARAGEDLRALGDPERQWPKPPVRS